MPESIADEVLTYVREDVKSFKMGSPEDMNNFITAVIHEGSFDKLAKYIDQAKADSDAEIIELLDGDDHNISGLSSGFINQITFDHQNIKVYY